MKLDNGNWFDPKAQAQSLARGQTAVSPSSPNCHYLIYITIHIIHINWGFRFHRYTYLQSETTMRIFGLMGLAYHHSNLNWICDFALGNWLKCAGYQTYSIGQELQAHRLWGTEECQLQGSANQ
jgi:hypothetical protein